MTLEEQLNELARMRAALVEMQEQRDLAYQAVLLTLEGQQWQHCSEQVTRLKAAVAGLEASVRESALEAYSATGERRPAHGVEIKLYTTVVIPDGDRAEDWTRTHLPGVLRWDRKKFEQAVKAGLVPEDIAHIAKTPKATIARTLEVQGE